MKKDLKERFFVETISVTFFLTCNDVCNFRLPKVRDFSLKKRGAISQLVLLSAHAVFAVESLQGSTFNINPQ